MSPSKRVLFVCVENACRSQMAEAFARMQGGAEVEAFSAGSDPSGEVNATAIGVMRELGYDLSTHASKSIEELTAEPFAAVVTMGCGDRCPAVEAELCEDWQIPDPKAMSLDQFRGVRDLVGQRVRALLARLVVLLLLTGTAGADGKARTDFVSLPESHAGDYVLTTGRNTGRHWGRPEMIRMLVLVAREWRRLYPRRPILRIGDISKKDGSAFPPHKTHRDGLAVDVFTRGTNICHVKFEDQKQTLELARLFFQFGAEQILYNHSYVIAHQKGVTKWPRHDDHFHVVVNPKKVPMRGGPILVPGPGVAGGAVLGRQQVRLAKDSTVTVPLRWQLLAAPAGWQKSYRLEVDQNRQVVDGLLFDSEKVIGGQSWRRVRLKLPAGIPFYWRVTVFGPAGRQLVLGWQELRIDLVPPAVTLTSPGEGLEIVRNPTFRWQSSERRGSVARVELATTSGHILWQSSKLGQATSHRLEGKLTPGRSYRWRVKVTDGVGNQGASDWRRITVSKAYRWRGDLARVSASALNLRAGPGSRHKVLVTLKKGQEVQVLGRRDKWTSIRVEIGGKHYVGYVWGAYLSR